MKHLDSFAPLAAQYDGFVLDLWGVVHDGVRPYPGAPECLRQLRAAGKRVVLLSNAPRRADAVRVQLRSMAIGDELYDGVMTSGEATHLMLRDRPDPWWQSLGRRGFHLGPHRDRNVVAGLPIELVASPADAGFVLNTGPDDEADPTDPAVFDPVLDACAAARLPMICANPDLEVIRGGVRVVCAGTLALRYAARGGDVRSLGKPDPAIYGPVLDILATPRARTLAVGDALRTDIAGAQAAGIDSCWVLGGLHGEHLRGGTAQVEAEAASAGLCPVAALHAFMWTET